MQQHNALFGNGFSSFVVAFRAKKAVVFVLSHCGSEEETQHAAHLVVKLFLTVFARLYALLVGIGQVISVVSLGFTCCKAVGPGAEFHIEAVLNSLIGIVRTAPVTYHYAVKLPVVL